MNFFAQREFDAKLAPLNVAYYSALLKIRMVNLIKNDKKDLAMMNTRSFETTPDFEEKVDFSLENILSQIKAKIDSKIDYERYHSYPSYNIPEFFKISEILKLENNRKIITELFKYKQENKVHLQYVCLLLSIYYLKNEQNEEAITCVNDLFKDVSKNKVVYADPKETESELITKLIVNITRVDKSIGENLLKKQFSRELNSSSRLHSNKVTRIVQGLLEIGCFDEQTQLRLLDYYKNLDNSNNIAMMELIKLIPLVTESNKKMFENVLLEKYQLELMRMPHDETWAQSTFNELVKLDLFDNVSIQDFNKFLTITVDQHVKHEMTGRPSKGFINYLDQLQSFIKDPTRQSLVARALINCYTCFTNMGLIEKTIHLSSVSQEELNEILSKLKSSDSNDNVFINSIRVLQNKNHFDEIIQSELLSFYHSLFDQAYLQFDRKFRNNLMKALISLIPLVTDANQMKLMNLIYKQHNLELTLPDAIDINESAFNELIKADYFNKVPVEELAVSLKTITQERHIPERFLKNYINQFEKLKNNIKGEARCDAINKALLYCYNVSTGSEYLEKSILLAKELKMDKTESSRVYRVLSEKAKNYQPNLVGEFLLKCHEMGDHDALNEAISYSAKKDKINDVIKYSKIAVIDATKTSDWSVIIRVIDRLIPLLAEQGGGFKREQLNEIKSITLLAYQSVFNKTGDIEVRYENLSGGIVTGHIKFSMFMLLFNHLNKTKMFVDLSELFNIMHPKYYQNVDFINLAIDYLPFKDAIQFCKITINKAEKVSDLLTIFRVVDKLFPRLTELGSGFSQEELNEIKSLIIFAYQSIFNETKDIFVFDEYGFNRINRSRDVKKELLNLFLGNFNKTRSIFMFNLSELFDALYSKFGFDKNFINLALSYFPKNSEKYNKYDLLNRELNEIEMSFQSIMEVSKNECYFDFYKLFQLLIEKFSKYTKYFNDPRFNSRFGSEICAIKNVAARIAYSCYHLNSLFSPEVEKLGFLSQELQEIVKDNLQRHSSWDMLRFYYEMYKSKNYTKKEKIDCLIFELSKDVTINSSSVGQINKHILLELSMDPQLEEASKSLLSKDNNEYQKRYYSTSNKEGKIFCAKQLVHTSHLPAIAFLINSQGWFGKKHGFDYLCLLMMVLCKGLEGKHDPEMEKARNKAKDRINKLPLKYRERYIELIQNAPVKVRNAHAYLWQNMKVSGEMQDVFLHGMKQALGFEQFGWEEWKKTLENMVAIGKANPRESVPVEKKEQTLSLSLDSKAEAKPQSEFEVKVKSEVEPQAKSKSEVKAEVKSEAKAESKVVSKVSFHTQSLSSVGSGAALSSLNAPKFSTCCPSVLFHRRSSGSIEDESIDMSYHRLS